jgi:hypothetical protein
MHEADAKSRTMPRRRDIPWDDIRAAYEAGNTNFSDLGRRYGVKRHSIAHRARAENWPTKGHIDEATRSNVIDMATRRAVEQMGDAGIDAKASAIAAELIAQAEIAQLAACAAEKILREYIADQIVPSEKQSKADVFNAVLAGVKRAIEIGREINGLTAGKPSVSTAEKRDVPVDQIVLIVRERGTTNAASARV